jgi:SMODS and SLOG-associating 2TM effector domain family 5
LLLLEGDNVSKETLTNFTERYGAILQKYSINHDEIDYSKYQLDRPEEHAWMTFTRKLEIRLQLARQKYTPDVFLFLISCLFGWLIWHGAAPQIINWLK